MATLCGAPWRTVGEVRMRGDDVQVSIFVFRHRLPHPLDDKKRMAVCIRIGVR